MAKGSLIISVCWEQISYCNFLMDKCHLIKRVKGEQRNMFLFLNVAVLSKFR